MIGNKRRVTRATAPRTRPHTRSTSPVIKNKKTKNGIRGTRKRTRKTTKPKPRISSEDLDEANHDLCDACHGTGQFICCEGCPSVFHFGCVEPPLDFQEVEELDDEWFCNECLYRKENKAAQQSTNKAHASVFALMIDDLNARNPKEFSLPNSIRDYFDGVSTGTNGGYVDATTVKAIKYRNGRPEEQDYHRLKDKTGHFLYCYWCYRSALQKPMISCDFCPLYWHLDCLNPPLTIPPNIAKKWKCPCHAQHHIRYRTPRNLAETENDAPLMPQPPNISTILLNEFSKHKDIDTFTYRVHAPKDNITATHVNDTNADNTNADNTDNTDNNTNKMENTTNSDHSDNSDNDNNDKGVIQYQSPPQQDEQSDDDFNDFYEDDIESYLCLPDDGDNFMSTSNKLLTKKERKHKKTTPSSISSSISG